MQTWEAGTGKQQEGGEGAVLHSPPRPKHRPTSGQRWYSHRQGHLHTGQTAGCGTKACLASWIPESCWRHGHLHSLDPAPVPQAPSPADMPICSLSTVSLTRNTPPACLGVAKGHGSLALVWGTWVRVCGSPAAVGVAPSEGQRWLARGCALSCCGRSGGAGRSPGGTVGRCAAAGSTVGSSRHGHRRGRPSGPVERESR